MGKISGPAVAAAAFGAVFAYAALKGKSVLTVVQGLVQGKAPASAPPANQITDITAQLADSAGNTTSTSTSGTGAGGKAGAAAGGSAAQNQAIARMLAQPYGWSSGAEWDALVSLWNSESGWSNTIWNTSASCGGDAFAFGIPQACGHGVRKAIPGHGSVCPFPAGNAGNPSECGGSNNASAQISWGLAYIKANYGSPVNVPHGGY